MWWTEVVSESMFWVQIEDLHPWLTRGDFRPPPWDVVSWRRSEERSRVGISGSNQVVDIGKMWKVGECEFITGQETSLPKPLIVHIKHFPQLLFTLFDCSLVLFDLHSGCECQLEHKSWRRWVEALSFCLQPLIYRCLYQWVCTVQFLVPLLSVFLANVPAYRSRLWSYFYLLFELLFNLI